MAVPKRKTSRSNTRSRRSQWKATTPDLPMICNEWPAGTPLIEYLGQALSDPTSALR